MQREHIIQVLVVDCLVSIFDRNQYCWLQGILENGFRGFAKMSNEELLMELRHRKLDVANPQECDIDFDIDDCIIHQHDLAAVNSRNNLDEM